MFVEDSCENTISKNYDLCQCTTTMHLKTECNRSKEGFLMKPSIATPWHHSSIHHFWRDLLYCGVPSCCGASALPATNGVFVNSTGVIVILWNINGVTVSFSHEWGDIVKQVLVDGEVTCVIEILKDNRCFWDFPIKLRQSLDRFRN